MTMIDPAHLWSLANEIKGERERQLARYPDCERLPDGTGGEPARLWCEAARARCDAAHKAGRLTHAHVFEEEVAEVLSETDPVRLRKELVQVLAVCAKWVADLDSREVPDGRDH